MFNIHAMCNCVCVKYIKLLTVKSSEEFLTDISSGIPHAIWKVAVTSWTMLVYKNYIQYYVDAKQNV